MANSSYAYVRAFESPDSLPLGNIIAIRLDGRGFTSLTKKYHFTKPNDARALNLMNSCAASLLRSIPEIALAYGQSDEYTFIFHEDTTLFGRRSSKLVSTVVSTFTAEYCLQWKVFFPDRELERPFPTFDGRSVCYPKRKVLRDALAWRQVDCHVNNLYNTVFWSLVLRGKRTNREAEEELKGSDSAKKNEILFREFGVNYNNEPQMFRKGTTVYREKREKGKKGEMVFYHGDIIQDGFWDEHPEILAGVYEE
ncbi:tRNAHis guanylyltransferase [Piedraia hortae CBS 480.64]|uniref:tRNA(His) guanylyltransferase n=1 Tax=Piedraia hortae CBS 480.64 TaxID=1314780 RepID=A0A6A7BTH9_9PEZI|nr:tRNAHis guanylyltransferase [Piedraia hortae CBS 480.64]